MALTGAGLGSGLSAGTRSQVKEASRYVAAVLVGLAVPSLVAGRVPIAILLAIAGLTLAVTERGKISFSAMGEGLRTPLARALIAMFVVWMVSAIVTLDPPRSWAVWGQTTAFTVGGALLVATLRGDKRLFNSACRALVAGAVLAGALAMIALNFVPAALDPFRTAEIQSVLDAARALRSYGSTAPCMAPIVLWAGWRLGGAWRWAGLAYLPIAFGIVLGTHSHAGMLGFIAEALALAIARLYVALPSQRRGPLLIALAALAISGAVAILSLLPTPPYSEATVLHLPPWLVDVHRQYIWGFAVDSGLHSPWIGYGLDTSGRVPGAKAFLPGLGNTETMPSHAHNWMFELFVESGSFGLGAALVALGCFTRMLLHAAVRSAPGAYAAIALSGAFFGSGLVNFSIWSAWWQASFLVLTALALAAHRDGWVRRAPRDCAITNRAPLLAQD